MNQIKFTLILLCISIQIFAQSNIEEYVKEGIHYHDNGEYDKAIEIYKNALQLDSKSTLINCEIAMSYLAKGDYNKAIEHSDIVLKQKSDLMLQAYITKGSALDDLGKTKESINLFEKAIKQVGGHYLLYYNLGLNYYKTTQLDKAEENVIKAIDLNPNHASSHLMLANIHNQQGNSVQTLLAAHYFLFLEPNSKRSFDAYQILINNFKGNVTKNTDNPNNTNILFSPNNDNQFAAIELMISLWEASKSLEKNKGKTEDELFIENTSSFFKMMGEINKEKHKDIWWSFYVTFFHNLANSEHIETYCKYISQSGNETSPIWLSKNEQKLINFDSWLKNN